MVILRSTFLMNIKKTPTVNDECQHSQRLSVSVDIHN